MKHRIKEVVDSAGNSKFYPQHKFLWWWCNYQDIYGDKLYFSDMYRCRYWMNYTHTSKTLFHEP